MRTPEEFTDGHLKGTANTDFNDPNFARRISELDKDGEYTLYCRSGRCSGLALEAMKAVGFTKVANAGGVEQVSKIFGLDIVKDRAKLGKGLRWIYCKDSVGSARTL